MAGRARHRADYATFRQQRRGVAKTVLRWMFASRRGWLAWGLWASVMIVASYLSNGAWWVGVIAFPAYYVIASPLGLPDRPVRHTERDV